jgi:hypothetical protein
VHRQLLLDMRAEVYSFGDHGLLSFAFHPDWAQGTTKLFVHYTGTPLIIGRQLLCSTHTDVCRERRTTLIHIPAVLVAHVFDAPLRCSIGDDITLTDSVRPAHSRCLKPSLVAQESPRMFQRCPTTPPLLARARRGGGMARCLIHSASPGATSVSDCGSGAGGACA